MNVTRSGVARRLALAATLLVAAGSEAQAYVWPQPTTAQASVFVPGLPGQTMAIWVSVLGGNSKAKDQLYFFQNGVGNPGTAIGPQGPGTNPWTASPNNTFLGVFTAGTELVFGVRWQYASQSGFVYSGAGSRNADGVTKAYNWGNGAVPEDNGVTPFPGTPSQYTVYGFEDDVSRRTRTTPFGDFNDVLFSVRAQATPEPASLVLLASGLLGVAGVGIARRRRKV